MSKQREICTALFWLVLAISLSLVLLIWSYSAIAADLILGWDISETATYYNIQISDNATIVNGIPSRMNWGEIRKSIGAGTTFIWMGAKEERINFFRVQACNDVDCATNYSKGVWYYPFSPPNPTGGLKVQ